jgi:uncharacterized protein (DUF2461 family)
MRMHPRFTTKTMSFLRAIKRNNNREWFASRKADYERDVRAPMVAVVEQLAKDFQRFAPELSVAQDLDLPHLPRHAIQRRQVAAEDADRRRVPKPRSASR